MASSTLLRLVPWQGGDGAGSANWSSNSHKLCAASRIRFITPAGGCSIRTGGRSIRPATVQSSARNGSDDALCPSVSHQSTPPSSSSCSPWLMLPPSFEETTTGVKGNMIYNFYSLTEDKVHKNNSKRMLSEDAKSESPENYVGSSHGWLALCNPSKGEQFLYNPLSGRRINLPHIDGSITKLVISCSPDEDEQQCRVMISFGTCGKIAFCTIDDDEWTPIGTTGFFMDDKFILRPYDDFVYSTRHKLFFCVTEFGDFEAWDLEDPSDPKMTPMVLSADEKNYPWGSVGRLDEAKLKRQWVSVKYLVASEQTGRLYLVRRFVCDQLFPGDYSKRKENDKMMVTYWTMSFDVHEIDRDRGELRYMETSLDGLAMFIGLNHGFAIPNAAELKLNPDSIYFTDEKEYTPPNWDTEWVYGGHDIGIFDYVNRDFSPCFYPTVKRCFEVDRLTLSAKSGVDKIKRIVPPPMWFTPTAADLTTTTS